MELLSLCGDGTSDAVQDAIPNELADEKVFLQGCDTQGRAVVVVLGQRHFTSKRNLEETIRLMCYVLDNAIAATDPVRNRAQQIICLFDLGGGSYRMQAVCRN